MLTYVSSGPRDFGEHPLTPVSRPCWEFYAVWRGKVAPLFPLGPSPRPQATTLWLFRPGCAHGWVGERASRASVAVFHFSEIPPSVAQVVPPGADWFAVRLARSEAARVARLARDLQPLVWNHDRLLNLHAQRALMDLAIALLSARADPSVPPTPARLPPETPGPSASGALRIQAAERWLRGHFHECPGVRDIARLIGVSPSHLRRLFLAELGCSPKDWMLRVQLEVATDLLARTDLKLAAVATESGFASCSTLCHAFRAARGLTPTAWRAANLSPVFISEKGLRHG